MHSSQVIASPTHCEISQYDNGMFFYFYFFRFDQNGYNFVEDSSPKLCSERQRATCVPLLNT